MKKYIAAFKHSDGSKCNLTFEIDYPKGIVPDESDIPLIQNYQELFGRKTYLLYFKEITE